MAYNAIYEKLAADPHDLVGAFAYIAYKQQKVDYCKSFGGRELSGEELCSFHLIAALDTSLLTYRRQGEALAQSFLNASLDDLVERAEAAAKKDTLSKQIETVQAVLSTRLAGIDKVSMRSGPLLAGCVTSAPTCWSIWFRSLYSVRCCSAIA